MSKNSSPLSSVYKMANKILNFQLNCDISITNSKTAKVTKLNSLVSYVLLLAGVRYVYHKFKNTLMVYLRSLVTGGWTGSGIFSLKSTVTQSSIFNDGWPSMKQIFRMVFRQKSRLLDIRNFENNKSKNVVVYGCCSHMGKLASNIMVKYGYSVILIDTNLEKL
tara:strand:- start:30 stop:521 length:492 start_codon:yes stop_codon:yes gene_type:complete